MESSACLTKITWACEVYIFPHKGRVTVFWKIISFMLWLWPVEGEEDERRVDGQRRRSTEEGIEVGREKLSCVTVILVDSWFALFHRSPYSLLGGLSGIKHVSVQTASENNISQSQSLLLCHMMALKHGYPPLLSSQPMWLYYTLTLLLKLDKVRWSIDGKRLHNVKNSWK